MQQTGFKIMEMQLPVMDNRNNAISKPDARKISDAQMRCLAKCIACFGIGLYIYAGEDLPEDEPKPPITGQKGEFQIVAPAKPDGDPADWLALIKTSSHMLLDLCSSDADVMTIFKKNKALFDTVKTTDPEFFKEMMGKFTETKNKFKE
jgi:hypothetical protein